MTAHDYDSAPITERQPTPFQSTPGSATDDYHVALLALANATSALFHAHATRAFVDRAALDQAAKAVMCLQACAEVLV